MAFRKEYKEINLWFRVMAYLAFILCTIRTPIASLGNNTTVITILMNVFIILGVNLLHLKKWIIILGIYTGLVFLVFSSSILMPFNILMLVYILRNEKIDNLVYINLISLVFFVIIIYFSLSTGNIQNHISLSHKGSYVNDLGFKNVNALALFEFNILCCLCLLFRNNKNIFLLTLYIVLGLLIYRTTLSRTVLMGYCGLVLGYILFIFNKIKRPQMKVLSITPIIISCLLIYVIINITKYAQLVTLSSGRLNIFAERWKIFQGVNLITGMDLEEGAYDGGYFMLLFLGGVPWLVFFLYVFYKNIRKYYSQYIPYVPFIFAILLFSVSESFVAMATGMSVVFWSIILHTKGFIRNTQNKFIIDGNINNMS